MRAISCTASSQLASMKVPPKRKGNLVEQRVTVGQIGGLNESPSEKEGKCKGGLNVIAGVTGLNESPSEKEGKSVSACARSLNRFASMKVPPKRKGNVSGPFPLFSLHLPQ